MVLNVNNARMSLRNEVCVEKLAAYILCCIFNRVLQDRILPSNGLRLPLCLVVLSVPLLTLVSRLAT